MFFKPAITFQGLFLLLLDFFLFKTQRTFKELQTQNPTLCDCHTKIAFTVKFPKSAVFAGHQEKNSE